MRSLVIAVVLFGCGAPSPKPRPADTAVDEPDPGPVCRPQDASDYFPDEDRDGFGDSRADPLSLCEDPGRGWSTDATDCDDSREDAHPGGEEVWYDGVDQACDGGNDFDQDGDGYVHEDWSDKTDADAPERGDCADEDPDWNPGSREIFGSSLDNDCDGAPGATHFRFDPTLQWVGPRRVVLGVTANEVVLVVSAERLTNGGIDKIEPGVMLPFDRYASAGTGPHAPPVFWKEDIGSPMGPGLDTVVANDKLYPAGSYLRASNGMTYLIQQQMTGASGSWSSGFAFESADHSDPYLDVDVEADLNGGEQWVFACGASTLHVMKTASSGGVWTKLWSAIDTAATGGSVCFVVPITPSWARGTVCDGPGVACTTYDLEPGMPLTPSPTQLWDNYTFGGAVTRERKVLAVRADKDGVVYRPYSVTYVLLQGLNVVAADVDPGGNSVYIAAIVEDLQGDRQVVVAYGNPEVGLVEVWYPPLEDGGRTLRPEDVAVHVDNNRVFVAVTALGVGASAGDDAVGWAILDRY